MLLFALLAGCAGRHVPDVRFVNAPIAWEVDDRHDVPKKPKASRYYSSVYHLEHGLVQHITDPMAAQAPARAANVNALDEVPDSTWFTNRIGARPLTVDEVRWGPNLEEGPEAHRPWTILGGKATGALPGFIFEDARGETYLLKFALPGQAQMETAADVIVQRLFWAAGYHVAEDRVVFVRPGDLRIAPDATTKDLRARKQPMTKKRIAKMLEIVDHEPDGTMRAVASRLLPGEPLGGHPDRGVRDGDPNDLVPHEERRELRAQYVFFAWVAHTDVKTDNWLDMWVEDPGDQERHWVEHYSLDFGKALGVMAETAAEPTDSFVYTFDPPKAALETITLGIWRRPGEGLKGPDLPGIGRFEAAHFRPAKYRPRRRYRPFVRLDRFDGFWAAKIVMRFTPAHIRAAVEAAKLADPRSRDYMVRTLVQRQRKTGEYWLSRVNPIDRPTVVETAPGRLRVCAEDLLIHYGLDAAPQATHYRATAHADSGRRLGPKRAVRARRDGHLCVDDLPVGPGPQGYTMVALVTVRDRKALPPVWVHVAREPGTQRPRVIGIWRE